MPCLVLSVGTGAAVRHEGNNVSRLNSDLHSITDLEHPFEAI
jgi:hypothetical protein